MKHRSVLLVAGLVALSLVAGSAGAADNGFYLGASFGRSELAIDDFDEDFDYNDAQTGYKVFLGYRFLTFLAVEASFVDFGTFQDSTSTVDVETDLQAFDGYAVGMLPLGIADLFAKVGVVSWDADIIDAIEEVGGSGSDSGTDMAYGLGLQVRIKSFAIRAEVELFDVEGVTNLLMVSAGGSYTF